jgi:16S rRNA (uracil1498-N3)-methyltransferase
MRRFLLPGTYETPTIRLEGDEAHHLLHVLRAAIGETIVVFNGEGEEAAARILDITQNTCELEILERRVAPPETSAPIILGTAVPKGERFDWLVEKTTELGVARLVPLVTRHSVVEPGPNKLDRMRRTIVAASKQCRRGRLMELDEPLGWDDFVARHFPGADPLVAHPGGESFSQFDLSMTRPVVLAVGPEGGLTEEEVAVAQRNGARLVGLGPRVLRIETAAVALAAMCCLR